MALEPVLIRESTALGWWLEQLTKLSWHRPDMVTTALNHLLSQDRELRWTMIVEAYMDEQINLGKAAEMLEMHELELRDRFLELGIPLRLGAANVAEARAEVEAVRKWFAKSEEGSPA